MKNEFLQALRDLKKELDEGRLSPEQYSTRRREILDEFDPPEDEGPYEDNETVAELLEDSNTVSELLDGSEYSDDTMEDENTVSYLIQHKPVAEPTVEILPADGSSDSAAGAATPTSPSSEPVLRQQSSKTGVVVAVLVVLALVGLAVVMSG